MKLLLDDEAPEHEETLQFFRDVAKGLVSYYYYNDPALFPTLKEMKVEKVNLSDAQFPSYEDGRKREFKQENPEEMWIKEKINNKMFDNMDFSEQYKEFFYFKVFSRIASNYVFPGIKKKNDENQINATKFFNDASDYLEPKGLIEYAPKINKILQNLKKSNGPALIYSQFRIIEGLGAVAAVLKKVGYSEIKINKIKGEFHIQTDMNAAKHFIVFSNANQEKMQVLMDLFNKNVSNLPKSIVKDMDAMNAKDLTVDVILITQSGSEGISLKGVRQVHMLEPYWNYVRISQVIGRAVRAKSHLHLPKEEQNVEVFMYLATLTPAQKQKMFWDKGKLSIRGMSTDEMIFRIAQRKEQTLGRLLTIMKETAMDCKIHLKKHLKIDPEMKCI
jgi:superfamily II DNA or RNA helicase